MGMNALGSTGWDGCCRRVRAGLLGSVGFEIGIGVGEWLRTGAEMVVLVLVPEYELRMPDVELDSSYSCGGMNLERKAGSAVARRVFDWSADFLVA